MKTKALIFFSLLICDLLPAQNIKLDITPHFLGVRVDSLFLSMDVSVEIENMEPKNVVRLMPVLTGQERKILLPSILLNGKQRQELYLRDQILRKKSEYKEENVTYLVAGIDESHSHTITYQTSLLTEDWTSYTTLLLRRTIIRPEGEQALKDILLITPQPAALPPSQKNPDEVTLTAENTSPADMITTKIKYKGSYVPPATGDADIRNQKELNFNLEGAKIMADVNPQMLSLRELYTVALPYADNKAKFYQIINIGIKLYPVHPIADLNAAAAAIEQGNTQSINKFLSVTPHDNLAYKNCRGVYELVTGNACEGIRVLKAAKTEGSEEASYNLNVFFRNNKRP